MTDSARVVLVVDDDEEVAATHARFLRELGYSALTQCRSEKVEALLDERPDIALVILDLRMPEVNGLELLLRIKMRRPQVGIVMATVVNDIEHAVQATKGGAYNYLLKPLQRERVAQVLESYFSNRPRPLVQDPQFSSFITGCPLFEEIFRRIRSFAEADVTVLIQGETGTGKELVAERIHALSSRRAKGFLPVNAAALSPQLFESELFGHRQGAFTGATQDHPGYFQAAAEGTLLLDEIGELEEEQQKKLLRVLETRRYCRVGETADRPLAARVLLSTNSDLQEKVREGRFRDDLYYRLSSHAVMLPPLRERPGDVEILSEYFLRKHASQYGREIKGIHADAIRVLARYPFPGNVRELEGVISGAVLIEKTAAVQASSLPPHIRFVKEMARDLDGMRYEAIMKAMAECAGNQSRAAEKLGVSRVTLNRWLKRYRDKHSSA